MTEKEHDLVPLSCCDLSPKVEHMNAHLTPNMPQPSGYTQMRVWHAPLSPDCLIALSDLKFRMEIASTVLKNDSCAQQTRLCV